MELHANGYENMGRFLASDLCKKELDDYAPESIKQFITDSWGGEKYVEVKE